MISLYAASMTLLIAGTFGTPGYLTWGFLWATALYRHMTMPPNKEKTTSYASLSHSRSQQSPPPPTPARNTSR